MTRAGNTKRNILSSEDVFDSKLNLVFNLNLKLDLNGTLNFDVDFDIGYNML